MNYNNINHGGSIYQLLNNIYNQESLASILNTKLFTKYSGIEEHEKTEIVFKEYNVAFVQFIACLSITLLLFIINYLTNDIDKFGYTIYLCLILSFSLFAIIFKIKKRKYKNIYLNSEYILIENKKYLWKNIIETFIITKERSKYSESYDRYLILCYTYEEYIEIKLDYIYKGSYYLIDFVTELCFYIEYFKNRNKKQTIL